MAFIKRTSKYVPTDMTWVGNGSKVTDNNKWWYDASYSTNSTALCLPNCTVYAMGRSGEIAGKSVKGYDMLNSSGFPNASNWYDMSLWEKGSVPKVGAVACWYDASGSGGHVAVVEETDGTDNGTYVSMSGYQNASSGTRSYTNPGETSWYFKYETMTQTRYWYEQGHPHSMVFKGYLYNPYVDEQPHTTPTALSSNLITSGNIKYVEWKNSYAAGDAYKYAVTVAMNPVVWGGTNNRFNLFTSQPNSSPGNDYELVGVINGNIWGNDGSTSYPMGFTKVANESVGDKGVLQYLDPYEDNLYMDVLAIGSTKESGGSTLYADLYQNMIYSLSSYVSALNGDLTPNGDGYCGQGAYVSAIHSFIGYNEDNNTAFMGYNSVAMTGANLIKAVKNIFGNNSKVAVLDGGGSTQMLLRGNRVKESSDSGGVRLVENAICIYQKQMIKIPASVARDVTKNQVQVNEGVTNLRARTTPNTASGTVIGYVNPNDLWDVISTFDDGTYTWYQIGEMCWIANNGTWLTYYEAQSTTRYTISTIINPEGSGSVVGSGIYNENETVTLSASPNNGYVFKEWGDGSTNNPYTFTATSDKIIEAIFEELPRYTISVASTPGGAGTFTGNGTYYKNQVVTLTTTPIQGYTFIRWDDGITENPRQITVTEDKLYIAIFEEIPRYTVNISANPEEGGTVTGSGTYYSGTQITITANAKTDYTFKQWSDGDTNWNRTITVNSNIDLVAEFEYTKITTYNVTISSSDTNYGTVKIQGYDSNNITVEPGTEIIVVATVKDGGVFNGWNNPDTSGIVTLDAIYTTIINKNTTLIGDFSKYIIRYSINAISNNNSYGSILGSGTYTENTQVTLSANPNTGYKFINWSNGETANPYRFNATENVSLIGYFALEDKEEDLVTFNTNVGYIGETIQGLFYENPNVSSYKFFWGKSIANQPYEWNYNTSNRTNGFSLKIDQIFETTFTTSITNTIYVRVNGYDSTGTQIKHQTPVMLTINIPDTFKSIVTFNSFTLTNTFVPSNVKTTEGMCIAGYTSYSSNYTVSPTAPTGYQNHADVETIKFTSNRGSVDSNGDTVFGVIPTSSSNYDFNLIGTVIDERGILSTSNSQTINVYGYNKPTVTLDSLVRCTEDGTPDEYHGNYCYISFKINLDDIPSNEIKELSININKTDYTDIKYNAEKNLYSAIIGNGTLDPNYNYNITISIVDQVMYSLGDKNNPVIYNVAYNSKLPLSLLDNKQGNVGVAFGIEASNQDEVQFALPPSFNPNIAFKASTYDDEHHVIYKERDAYQLIKRGGINSMFILDEEERAETTYANCIRVMTSAEYKAAKDNKSLAEHTLCFLSDTENL